MGLVREDNDLCQSEFFQFLPNHTHVNMERGHSLIDSFLGSKFPTAIAKLNSRIYIAR